jgi:hypothetical protein
MEVVDKVQGQSFAQKVCHVRMLSSEISAFTSGHPNFFPLYTHLTRNKIVREILLNSHPQSDSESVRGLPSTKCIKKGLHKYDCEGNPLHETSFPSMPSGVLSAMNDIHKNLLSTQLSWILR